MYILGIKVLSQIVLLVTVQILEKREPQMLYEITIAKAELSHWRYQTLYNIAIY